MIKKFIYNLENKKVYNIILLVIILFSITMLQNFYFVKDELETLSKKNRIGISKDIDYSIYSWIENRINNLESNEKYLPEKIFNGDVKELKNYLDIFLNNKYYFDTVQAYINDVFFYVNDANIYDFREKLSFDDAIEHQGVVQRPWFFNTKQRMKTTMTIMNYHGILLEKTINICTPIMREKDYKGILCGVIKVDNIFEKLKKMHFPDNVYYFISDKNGKILTEIDIEKSKIVKQAFKNNLINENSHEAQQIKINSDFVTIHKFKHFDWYIGVGVNYTQANQNVLDRFTEDSLVLFIFFILVIIIISGAHTLIYEKVEEKKKEYEYMLNHRSRISEIGELVSGINHQLYQPINSLTLLLSNTILLQKQKKLDENTLSENLLMCKKATTLLSKTIEMFRNFYRCNESVTEFSLEDAISNVLQVIRIDLIRNNILIDVVYLSDKNNTVVTVENFLQQILLVLIQNAKEAILSGENFDKRILIQVNVLEEYAHIDVIDKADGISEELMPTLFENFKSSKKDTGSGIGLYFAKKLAKEKLLGDLILKRSSFPTVFRLSFLTKLKIKEETCKTEL
jgi:signal transduction histidine kinase